MRSPALRRAPHRGAQALLVAILASAVAPNVSAHPFAVDQESLPLIRTRWSLVYLAPVGQEFTPTKTTLDAVELIIANTDVASPFPADILVRVHRSSIDGPVVGTSLTVTLPFGSDGVQHFDFPLAVPLIPGQLFVMEVVPSGQGNPGIAGGSDPPYSGGRVITLGNPGQDDLWFREGTAIPTPVDEPSWGRIKALYRFPGAGPATLHWSSTRTKRTSSEVPTTIGTTR